MGEMMESDSGARNLQEKQILHDDCEVRKIRLSDEREELVAEALQEVRDQVFGQQQQDEQLTDNQLQTPKTKLRAIEDIKSSIVPAETDVYDDLFHYIQKLEQTWTSSTLAARAQQHRPTHTDLGIDAWDLMNDTHSLPHRIAFLNGLAEAVEKRVTTKVAAYTTTASGLYGVRKDILPWIQYHTELGVSKFYVLYDGHDEEAVFALSHIKHVKLIFVQGPHASAVDIEEFKQWGKKHIQWGGKPGNFQLMVKQGYGTKEALRMAQEAGWEWMVHIDPDEFLRPGAPNGFSVASVLGQQPNHVSSLRFMNYEGQPESGDVVNKFEQVTLFRTHKLFVTPEAYYHRNKLKLGDNRSYLVLYANGKSAVRVDAPGVRQLGPHFFRGSDDPRWITPQNPKGEWRDAVSNDTVILHYAYSQLQDVTGKAERSCPQEYVDAARAGDREKVKECFVIDFDQDAFMAAATGEPEEVEDFFFSRMVLSEGSRVRCKNGHGEQGWCILEDINHLKQLIQHTGLTRRFFEPKIILRSHERVIKLLIDMYPPQTVQKNRPKVDLSIDVVGPKLSQEHDTYKNFIASAQQDAELQSIWNSAHEKTYSQFEQLHIYWGGKWQPGKNMQETATMLFGQQRGIFNQLNFEKAT
eukprot:TRINITY_DN25552_c0_g1_i3.p1 TRINITY_DN25552_c0_g1~~TRINITY_DN25552_c0_g1_i3.p1  ORF type:complete len:728 (-),score=153.66 TRINITY_DN25552_c0_g1_i3:96-2009(-)